MSVKKINFDENKKFLKSDFYKNKKINNIDDIDVKYFIGYNDNDLIRPLMIDWPYTNDCLY